MSFIKNLLSTGIMAGRLCQVLQGDTVKYYTDAKSGDIFSGSYCVGGVTFYTSVTNGNVEVNAHNPNVGTIAMISLANGTSTNGVQYSVPFGNTAYIIECCDPTLSPMIQLNIVLQDQVDVETRASKIFIPFIGLMAHKTIKSFSYSISVDKSVITIGTNASFDVSAISSLSMTSDKGVSFSTNDPISPKKQDSLSGGEKEYSFEIDFESVGICVDQDCLDGYVEVEVPSNSFQSHVAATSSQSRPLSEAEKMFFNFLQSGN